MPDEERSKEMTELARAILDEKIEETSLLKPMQRKNLSNELKSNEVVKELIKKFQAN
jgi:hypothetical protein